MPVMRSLPWYPLRPGFLIKVNRATSNRRRSKAEADAWTGDPSFADGIYHFAASSEEIPACVVEPGTPEDLGKIVRPFRLHPPVSFPTL